MPVTSGVIGTDGRTPIYDPNGRWQLWNINEIYLGKEARNKYVPKVDDYVVDTATSLMYIVVHVNDLNLVATLREVKLMNAYSSFTGSDLLLGVGPGTQSDTYRVYIDNTTIPFTLSVDRRLFIGGSMSSTAKIFLGSDLTNDGTVISRVYDNNGAFVSDSIILELVDTDTHLNHAIKIIPTCYCNAELPDNEIVTCVFYDDLGQVVSKRQLLVENTGFIPRPNAYTKYITSISIESAYLSPTLDYTIEFPVNVTINAISLMGVVTYSDGSVIKLPVDGTKFKLHGLDQYVSTIIGHKHELVLAYVMDKDERAYNTVSFANGIITTPYHIVTVKPNLSYAVKLIAYPEFIDEATGYVVNFFLVNLDRNILFNVTDKVRFADSTGTFNPKGYGYMQRKAVTINLREVSLAFKPYIHLQLMDIVLKEPPQLNRTAWLIANTARDLGTNNPELQYGGNVTAADGTSTYSGPTSIQYGDGVQAVVQTPSTNIVKIDCGETSIEHWLNKVYLSTYPLIDNYVESRPLTPNFIRVKYNNSETEYNISKWDSEFNLSGTVRLGSNLTITFVKKVSGKDLILSIAQMVIV